MGGHPDQGRLLQSIGGPDYKEPSLDSARTTPDDAFLLCTDGFWERTTEAEMAEVLYAPRAGVKHLLTEAVQRAVERNGPRGDNLTVAVALPRRVADTQRPAAASAPGSAPAVPGGRKWLVILLIVVLVSEVIVGVYYFAGAWLRTH
jgi:hypothetical protein